MEQMAAPHTVSHYGRRTHDAPVQTMSARSADAAREQEALDWPPLSPESVRWMVVIGGGMFAAAVGALLGGAMSL